MSIRTSFRTHALLLAAASASLTASPAYAQDEAPVEDESRGRTVTIGLGAQAYPSFPGADNMTLAPMPILGVRRTGDPIGFEAPDEGFGFGLLGRDSAFNIGPAIQFQNRRRDEDVGAAVGEVGFTVEAGAFAELYLGDSFRLRAEGRKGIGGHEGFLGDFGADFIARNENQLIFSIGPRVRFADNRYMDAYYGVTPQVAAQTSLGIYDPGSGIHAIGATAGLLYQLSYAWGIHSYARYDRLVRDAADSPIVREFGSRHQFSAGLGLSYTFDMGGGRR